MEAYHTTGKKNREREKKKIDHKHFMPGLQSAVLNSLIEQNFEILLQN
jgi:hypothetical protein